MPHLTSQVTKTNGIIVCGGDGLVHEVITGYFQHPNQKLIHANVPVGITPCGTANAMAWELHTHEVRTKLAVVGRATLAVAKGKSRKVDVIKCTQDPKFLSVRDTKKLKKVKKAAKSTAGPATITDAAAEEAAAAAEKEDDNGNDDEEDAVVPHRTSRVFHASDNQLGRAHVHKVTVGDEARRASVEESGAGAAIVDSDGSQDIGFPGDEEEGGVNGGDGGGDEHGADGDEVLEMGLVGHQIPTKASSISKSKGSKSRKEMLAAKRGDSSEGTTVAAAAVAAAATGGGGAAVEDIDEGEIIAIDKENPLTDDNDDSNGVDGAEAAAEGTAEENAAATKIQASFRGHRARTEMEEGKKKKKKKKTKSPKGALGNVIDDTGSSVEGAKDDGMRHVVWLSFFFWCVCFVSTHVYIFIGGGTDGVTHASLSF